MWCFSREYKSNKDLKGTTAVVTGGNTGIGYETAKFLFEKGARVLILCRNEDLAKTAIEKILETTNSTERRTQLIFKHLDLASLASVRKCAEEILNEEAQIQLLINNAGVMTHPIKKTKDGFEMHMGTNYFGPFLLTMLLLPIIISSAPARIVNVSSLAHKFMLIGGRLRLNNINFENGWYHQLSAYGQSKLALVMFTKELAKKLKDANIHNVTTYSLHPGIIATELGRNFSTFLYGASWMWSRLKNALLKTPQQGAATTLYCALDDATANESGFYYDGCTRASMDTVAKDEHLREMLWQLSKEQTNLVGGTVVAYELVLLQLPRPESKADLYLQNATEEQKNRIYL